MWQGFVRCSEIAEEFDRREMEDLHCDPDVALLFPQNITQPDSQTVGRHRGFAPGVDV